MLDVNVDDVRFRIEMLIPHVFDNGRLAHRFGRGAHQKVQQGKFTPRQFDPFATARGVMADQVEFQVGNSHQVNRLRALTAQQGPQAGKQFRHGKRLGKIIITARVEPYPKFKLVNIVL